METTMTMARVARIWSGVATTRPLMLPVLAAAQGSTLPNGCPKAHSAVVRAAVVAPISGALGNGFGYAPKTTDVHRSATGRPPL